MELPLPWGRCVISGWNSSGHELRARRTAHAQHLLKVYSLPQDSPKPKTKITTNLRWVAMNLRAIVPILLALCVALIGSFLTYRWVKLQVRPSTESVEQAAELVSIAVAAVDLAWGKQLAEEDLKWECYLEDSLPPGSFKSPEKLEGRVLVFPIKANEPVLESRLAPTSVKTGGIAAIVEPGKRAIAVKGDKVIGLSGLIRPGNRVDVLVTVKEPGKKRSGHQACAPGNTGACHGGNNSRRVAKGRPRPWMSTPLR